MEKTDTHEPPRKDSHRGTRHLRVGLEISARSVTVTSMWVVDQPVVQASRLVGGILARVDVGGRPALVQAFSDPRVTRGVYRREVGHSRGIEESGIVYVSVPFTDLRELADVRIRLLDASKSRASVNDVGGVARLFDSLPESMGLVADIDTGSLKKHHDWLNVAQTLGIPAEAGRFEIFVDRDGTHRWRLRRASGEVVAESGQSFASRDACERDIQWVRTHAARARIVSLDVPGNQCAP